MSRSNTNLGQCPECGASIPEVYLLIEYKTASGDDAAFAECPNCGEVVAPEA
jgi:predicted RNA-binding Zn-ribbon protein involved in translation (DUF1610 family)